MSMKRPSPQHRLPVAFGDEPRCDVPVRIGSSRDRRRMLPSAGGEPVMPHPGQVKAGAAWVNSKFKQVNSKFYRTFRSAEDFNSNFVIQHSPIPRRSGFSLIEILVVLALISLITVALMAVFSTTQKAFRASITTADTLEGGRALMDLITSDLETMTPSYGISNAALVNSGKQLSVGGPVNFCALVKTFTAGPPSPLMQPLIGSPTPIPRTNVLEDIFILSKGNINGVASWIGTGYSVTTNLADGTLYPLYRFYMATNAASGAFGQFILYTNFIYFNYTNSASWSHLMDGVVHLTARCYDTNGVWMTNGYSNPLNVPVHNSVFIGSPYSEPTCYFFSNTVPAAVQIEMGKLEDRTLEHAQSLSGINQSNYLSNASGQLRIFTRRVWIRNLDPSAYQ